MCVQGLVAGASLQNQLLRHLCRTLISSSSRNSPTFRQVRLQDWNLRNQVDPLWRFRYIRGCFSNTARPTTSLHTHHTTRVLVTHQSFNTQNIRTARSIPWRKDSPRVGSGAGPKIGHNSRICRDFFLGPDWVTDRPGVPPIDPRSSQNY